MRWSNSIGGSNDFYVGDCLGYLTPFLHPLYSVIICLSSFGGSHCFWLNVLERHRFLSFPWPHKSSLSLG